MNAGFANLYTLKSQVLSASLVSGTDYDAKLTAIGLGVAGLFEQYCNRAFRRVVADTVIFSAGRPNYYLPRFPLEAVTKLETRSLKSDSWTEDTSQPASWNESTGLIDFGLTLGDAAMQVRVTYTGGYFWDEKEPADNGYPTSQPSGSTALPEVLKLAWFLQCAEVWNKMDKLGLGLVNAPDKTTATGTLDFTPLVKEMLHPFRRFVS